MNRTTHELGKIKFGRVAYMFGPLHDLINVWPM